ncbi:MAG TPA: DUF167 domain-containing protein [Verrucomicrobiae bacterium]
MSQPNFLRPQKDGVLLSVKLQPRASRNEIGEALGEELRIKVTAPPVDAAANEALLRLVAEHLGCPRRQVVLERGQTSRHKTIKLYGLTLAEAAAKFIRPDSPA